MLVQSESTQPSQMVMTCTCCADAKGSLLSLRTLNLHLRHAEFDTELEQCSMRPTCDTLSHLQVQISAAARIWAVQCWAGHDEPMLIVAVVL